MAAFGKYFYTIFLSSVLLVSCASTDIYSKIDDAVLRGDFAEGVAELESQQDSFEEKDEVLLYLDMGMLTHYAEDYSRSSELLQNGERAIEEAFAESITRGISSYLINDSVLEYGGEDYEDIYVNVFNSLNYYHRGDLDGALVEIRRIGNKLRYLSTKYGTIISNLQNSMEEQDVNVDYEVEPSTVAFSDSALARYMSMLFYRGEGLQDDARIDRDAIKQVFSNQAAVYPFSMPSSLDEELEIPRGKARLNVISFNGLSPIKVEEVERIPTFVTNSYLKIALPVMVSRPSIIASTEVVLDSGERFELELIEDIDLIAKETFKTNLSTIYMRTMIRSVAKTATSATLDAAAEYSDDGSSLVFGILSLGTQIFAEVSEQADLRVSRYFPGRALVGGINLNPGTYSFTVNYYDQRHRLVYEQRFENVLVRENRLNMVEGVCLK